MSGAVQLRWGPYPKEELKEEMLQGLISRRNNVKNLAIFPCLLGIKTASIS